MLLCGPALTSGWSGDSGERCEHAEVPGSSDPSGQSQ